MSISDLLKHHKSNTTNKSSDENIAKPSNCVSNDYARLKKAIEFSHINNKIGFGFDMTGKGKCELLKAIRKTVAEKHGVELPPVPECTNKGPCPGYCPVCDEEARLLSEAVGDFEERIEITDPEIAKRMKEIRQKYQRLESQSCTYSHSDVQDVICEHKEMLERIKLLHRDTVNKMNSFPKGSLEYTIFYNNASDLKKQYKKVKNNLNSFERSNSGRNLGIVARYSYSLFDELDGLKDELHRELNPPPPSADGWVNPLAGYKYKPLGSFNSYYNRNGGDEEIIKALEIPSSASTEELTDAINKILLRISSESNDIFYQMSNFDVTVLDNESDFRYRSLDERSTELFNQKQIINVVKKYLKKRDAEG